MSKNNNEKILLNLITFIGIENIIMLMDACVLPGMTLFLIHYATNQMRVWGVMTWCMTKAFKKGRGNFFFLAMVESVVLNIMYVHMYALQWAGKRFYLSTNSLFERAALF